MKKDKMQKTDRREAIKILGLGSVAIAAGGYLYASPSQGLVPAGQQNNQKTGPDDGPNQPMGKEVGIYPGRVVWAWNPEATNAKCTNAYSTGDFFFNKENYSQAVVDKMIDDSIKSLTGKKTISKSWDALFKDFNLRKKNSKKGYTAGEKIYIKINQTSARGSLPNALREQGKLSYLPYNPDARRPQFSVCETAPPVVLGILRHLIDECGINQSDIAIGDPQNPLWDHNYQAWHSKYPNVKYTDCMFAAGGRTLMTPGTKDILFLADKSWVEKTYDYLENADYLINIPQLKCHKGAGITITAKNFFGAHSKQRSDHFHYAHPTRNRGYKKYRVMVDLMGSKTFGRNSMLCIVEGLWGGGSGEVGPPVRYFMPPFNNGWTNSIFMSQDQVAIDSVCFDFLRTEWNGVNKHDAANNSSEDTPNVNGVDDYLHQAADSANWPEGIVYDSSNSGTPLPSLGVHEHWNNAEDKQYSRNLGKGRGIELVTIPADLVKRVKA